MKVTDVKKEEEEEDRYNTTRSFEASVEICWKRMDFNFTPPYHPLTKQVHK